MFSAHRCGCGERFEQAWLKTSLRIPLKRRRHSVEGMLTSEEQDIPKVPVLCDTFPSQRLWSPWGSGRDI